MPTELGPLTPRAAAIVRAIFFGYAGPYDTAKDDTGRDRVVRDAARVLEPLLREIEREAARDAAMNPS